MSLLKRIITDDIQLIRISPGVPLTSMRISTALQRAASNRMYAKFYTDKYFIQVNFARDGDISVSSNIRSPQFVSDLWRKSKQGWTIPVVKSFLYQWLQISRKVLY